MWRSVLSVMLMLSTTAAIAQQQPAKPNPAKPAPKPAAKPMPTPAEQALAAELARLKTVAESQRKLEPKMSQLAISGQLSDADKADVDQYFLYQLDALTSFATATTAPEIRQRIRATV